MRNFCPFCVPCGIFSSALPSIVGTSIFAPSPASDTVTGTCDLDIVAVALEKWVGSTRIVM